MTEATSAVRFEMMQNRLHLQSYLLSGDTRDVDKMNDGERKLEAALRHAEDLANSPQQRSSLEKVQAMEQAWGNRICHTRCWTSAGLSITEMPRWRNSRFSICKKIRNCLGLSFHRHSGRC